MKKLTINKFRKNRKRSYQSNLNCCQLFALKLAYIVIFFIIALITAFFSLEQYYPLNMLKIKKPPQKLTQLALNPDSVCQARLGGSVTNFLIYKGYYNYNKSAFNSISSFNGNFYPAEGKKTMKVQLSNCPQNISDTTGVVQYVNVEFYDKVLYPIKIITAVFGFGTPVAMVIAGILVSYFCEHWCRCRKIKCKDDIESRQALFVPKTL